MRTLYHGSPFRLAELKPFTPRGHTAWNQQHGVYFTNDRIEASLYSLARDKERKNKAWGLIRKRGSAYLLLREKKWKGEEGKYSLNEVGYLHVCRCDDSEVNPTNSHEFIVKRAVTPDRVEEVRLDDRLRRRIRYLDEAAWDAYLASLDI